MPSSHTLATQSAFASSSNAYAGPPMPCVAGNTRTGEMRALQHTVGAARSLPAALRPRALPQRASYRSTAAVRAAVQNLAPQPQGSDSLQQIKARLQQANDSGSAASPASEQAAPQVKPAEDDRTRFQLHWSVEMWRTFASSKWMDSIDNEAAPVSDRMRAFSETLTSAVSTAGILGSTESARYWAYHLTRSGFFMVQGLAGLLAARNTIGRDVDSPVLTRFESMFRRGWTGPLTEALLMFYQDYENIKEGKFATPWDMTTLSHRQFNPLYILQRGARFLSEATETLRRRDAGVADPIWLKSGLVPDYYNGTSFHYQSDSWMSMESAKVYETSTETLFVGRQDAMQRSTLVPLRDFMAGKDASQMQALEIAAGTGRFATYVKDNYPSLQLTVTDLSPFYLAEARSNIKYWKKKRAPAADFGGIDGSGVTFLQTAAEKLDVPDNSMDIVYCVYLFHELPADVRRKAVEEMARVVKPGGIVVLTDSAQLGDREVMDATLGSFGDFNEPYYRDYIVTPLGPLFEAAGLKCGMKLTASTTKTLSFYKPLEDPNKPQATDEKVAEAGSGADAAATPPAVEVVAEAAAAAEEEAESKKGIY